MTYGLDTKYIDQVHLKKTATILTAANLDNDWEKFRSWF